MIHLVTDVRDFPPQTLAVTDPDSKSDDLALVGTIVTRPTGPRARQEFCMISWALANTLGISPEVGLVDDVAIRVGLEGSRPDPGYSALYTVIGTFWTFPVKQEIRFFPDHGSEIGGAHKLYGGDPPAIARVKTWNMASARQPPAA